MGTVTLPELCARYWRAGGLRRKMRKQAKRQV
jgi:hypothetical protein